MAAGLSRLLKLGARADDWVLVHDAARCLVRAEWIDRLIDVCGDDPVGGLLAHAGRRHAQARDGEGGC